MRPLDQDGVRDRVVVVEFDAVADLDLQLAGIERLAGLADRDLVRRCRGGERQLARDDDGNDSHVPVSFS